MLSLLPLPTATNKKGKTKYSRNLDTKASAIPLAGAFLPVAARPPRGLGGHTAAGRGTTALAARRCTAAQHGCALRSNKKPCARLSRAGLLVGTTSRFVGPCLAVLYKPKACAILDLLANTSSLTSAVA